MTSGNDLPAASLVLPDSMTSAHDTAIEKPAMAISAAGICRRYGRRWALADVHVEVPRGTSLLVVGHNGSGKSTLFRVLSTAIRADRGTATIEGFDLRHDRQEVRRRVALLSHYMNTYEALTAMQNLQVSARFLGRTASRESLMHLLELVGLAERADDPVLTFSAGMRKRIALSRTLLQVGEGVERDGAVDASVVMLDEPYGQLDPQGFRFVDRLFERLHARGVTVLLSTHQLERGAAICQNGIVLSAGRVIWSGPASGIPGHSGLQQRSDDEVE